MSTQRISVVGLGLIGGSIAAASRATGAHVRAYDANPGHVYLGLERGLIDEAVATLSNVVVNADIVVVATPVGTITELLREIDALGCTPGLILDTGSVKVPIVHVMNHLSLRGIAVGGHPIAGKEVSGPESADASLLSGRPFILTPTSSTQSAALERARQFIGLIGMQPTVMDAERHDAVLARTSHLPQLLSTALALTMDRNEVNLTGPGFRDMSRLARSNPQVWSDILFANDHNVVTAVNHFVDELQGLMAAIEDHDDAALTLGMERGREVAELAHSGVTP